MSIWEVESDIEMGMRWRHRTGMAIDLGCVRQTAGDAEIQIYDERLHFASECDSPFEYMFVLQRLMNNIIIMEAAL